MNLRFYDKKHAMHGALQQYCTASLYPLPSNPVFCRFHQTPPRAAPDKWRSSPTVRCQSHSCTLLCCSPPTVHSQIAVHHIALAAASDIWQRFHFLLPTLFILLSFMSCPLSLSLYLPALFFSACYRILTAAFQQRRKMMRQSLKGE